MKLISASTLEIDDHWQSIPPYAILSHTWAKGEVTFQDMTSSNRPSKEGFAKIQQMCDLTLENGLDYAWVDTCCIDKSSSAELTESINSMFQWYRDAVECYVYLEDLPPHAPTRDKLTRCRWFSRGWTLQELLAPKKVKFYDMAWNYRGSKLDFVNAISDYTGIPRGVLRGHDALASCSVAKRMSWAARRQTMRVEDMGYCLMGIFDVNMPLIYGEGTKAFRRLQEEIIKRNSDLSIFAWDTPQSHEQRFLGLFATSPAAFVGSSDFVPFPINFPNFSVTNKGLLVSSDLPSAIVTVTTRGESNEGFLLLLGAYARSADLGGIRLCKLGPKLFYRDGRLPLASFRKDDADRIIPVGSLDYYILIDPTTDLSVSHSTSRDCAVHVPSHHIFRLRGAVPEALWDCADRVFLRQGQRPWGRYPMVIAMAFHGKFAGRDVYLVALCDYRKLKPTCKLFNEDQYRRQAAMIFKGRYRGESIYWADLVIQAPEMASLSNSVKIRAGNEDLIISVSFKKGIVESVSTAVKLFSLNFDIQNAQADGGS